MSKLSKVSNLKSGYLIINHGSPILHNNWFVKDKSNRKSRVEMIVSVDADNSPDDYRDITFLSETGTYTVNLADDVCISLYDYELIC